MSRSVSALSNQGAASVGPTGKSFFPNRVGCDGEKTLEFDDSFVHIVGLELL